MTANQNAVSMRRWGAVCVDLVLGVHKIEKITLGEERKHMERSHTSQGGGITAMETAGFPAPQWAPTSSVHHRENSDAPDYICMPATCAAICLFSFHYSSRSSSICDMKGSLSLLNCFRLVTFPALGCAFWAQAVLNNNVLGKVRAKVKLCFLVKQGRELISPLLL